MNRLCFSILAFFGVEILSPYPVGTCGGSFRRILPMNQADERVLFVVGGDTVTTGVQIQYNGNSEDFARILSAPSVSKLAVCQKKLLLQLQLTIQPWFSLDSREDETCGIVDPLIFRTFQEAIAG